MFLTNEVTALLGLRILVYSQSAVHAFVARHPFCYWREMGLP